MNYALLWGWYSQDNYRWQFCFVKCWPDIALPLMNKIISSKNVLKIKYKTQHVSQIAFLLHNRKQNVIFKSFSLGGNILQNSVAKMSSVQMMESAMMGCGGPTVRAWQVSQAAGKITFLLSLPY